MKMQNLMLIKFGEVKRDLQQKKINSHTVLSDCVDVQDYDFGERLSLFRRFFIRNRFGYCWYIGSVSFCFNTHEISSKVQRLTFLLAQGLLWNWHRVVSKFKDMSYKSPTNNSIKPFQFFYSFNSTSSFL